MSTNLDYCNDFLMPAYGSPAKLYLNTIPEDLTESSSMTAVTISPLDFSGQLKDFFQPQDMSSPLKQVAQAPPWTSPRLPRNEHKAGVQNYLEDVLNLADKQKLSKRRVRFDDLGVNPRKRAKMETRLEELVYQESQQEDMMSDSDLIKFLMLALHGVRQDNAELLTHVKRLEVVNTGLVEMNQKQTERRVADLQGFVKQRGLKLKRQGESLVAMAEEEADTSSR